MSGRSMNELIADASVKRAAYPGTVGASALLQFNTSGCYVRVQLAGTNFLSLAEVEVAGLPLINRPPILTAPLSQSLPVGNSPSLQLVASDPEADKLSFAATGLPNSLTVNPNTGLISGTLSTAGSFSPTVTVTDARGASASQTFGWTVTAGAPQIAPISTPVVTVGSQASYTANATGNGALQYRCNFGDGSGTTAYSSSPSVTHVHAASGVYEVIPDGTRRRWIDRRAALSERRDAAGNRCKLGVVVQPLAGNSCGQQQSNLGGQPG